MANQYALMVNAKLPVNNVAELVALARKEPGKLTYFSVGIGSATHLNSAWFTQAAGINVTHVPYKGVSQGLLDVIGGTIDMGFGPTNSDSQGTRTSLLGLRCPRSHNGQAFQTSTRPNLQADPLPCY